MKTINIAIIAAAIISFLVIGCEKENETEEIKKTNHLKIGDTEYNLTTGTLENYGQDEAGIYDVHNTDLTLFSDGITITDEDEELVISGSGQIIYFEMFSSTGTSLDIGTYNFNIQPFSLKTFDYADYIIDWNDTVDDDDWTEIASGEVTVTKNSNEYEITINCIDKNGLKITGFFKGTLLYFDYIEE
jgi:hypothetical protein